MADNEEGAPLMENAKTEDPRLNNPNLKGQVTADQLEKGG